MATKALFYKLFTKKLAFGSLLTASIILLPALANAGLLSFMGVNTPSKTEHLSQNSQNMPVLQVSTSISSLGKGDADIVIDDAALVADSGPVSSSADGTVPAEAVSSPLTVYTVRQGDTISSIAKLFSRSEATIIGANDLKKGQSLTVGDTLVIWPVDGSQYKVKKGDTLSAIAKRFKADPSDIVLFNGLADAGSLTAGDTILIPTGDGGSVNVDQPKKIAKAPVTIAKDTSKITKDTAPAKTEKPIPSAVVSAPIADTSTDADADGGTVVGAPIPVHNVTSGEFFAPPVDEGRISQGLHGFDAVDIAAPTGTLIHASADGEVIVSRSGYNGGYGNYVVLQHKIGDANVQTLYAHMSKRAVDSGTTVKQGDIIGYVGSTGHSTGPHVHFEVRGAKNPAVNWY